MYGPLLRLEGVRVDNGWNEALARDYERLRFHISFWEATDAGCDATTRSFLQFRRSAS